MENFRKRKERKEKFHCPYNWTHKRLRWKAEREGGKEKRSEKLKKER